MKKVASDAVKVGGVVAVALGILVAVLPGMKGTAGAIAVCSVVLAVLNGMLQYAQAHGIAGRMKNRIKLALRLSK